MLNTIINLIKRCRITKARNDSGQFTITQVSYMGKTAECEAITPYGLYSNSPAGSLGVMFNNQGQEESRVGIFNVTTSRFKNLLEGEVLLGNTLTKTNILLDKDGSLIGVIKKDLNLTIDVDNNITVNGNYTLNTSNTATINAPALHVVGNLIVDGTISANNGAITMSGNNINTTGDIKTTLGDVIAGTVRLKTHVHSGVTSGASNTGAPV